LRNSAVFVGVPQGVNFRAQITPIPEGYKVTAKNAQRNKADDIDSDLNGNGLTDRFSIPAICGEFFDTIDIGFYATA
jgi:hypothetical protein